MIPIMHEILRHDATIINRAILPISKLSEETAEARNENFCVHRQHFAIKFAGVSCNREIQVLNRLLLNSDPMLSIIRNKIQKKSKPLSEKTLDQLVPETFDVTQNNSEGKETTSKSESD